MGEAQVIKQPQSVSEVVQACETQFSKVNSFGMQFKKEALFACQALRKNEFLGKVAWNNQASLKNAVLNVAAIGISLNPALNDAYLVPRKGVVCLDISYKGLIKIATESGAIKWTKAELVYEADTFVYKGPAEMPEHHADPFAGDRGPIKGVYCISKTKDDDILVEIMTAKDIADIKGASEAYKRGKGPWVDWEGEMTKKAAIKRASKTWPRVEVDDRLREAIDMLNEAEGYEFDQDSAPERVNNRFAYVSQEQLALAAPLATEILSCIETDDYMAYGKIHERLTEGDMNALSTAKSKGGYLNAQEQQAMSDLTRKYLTKKHEINESIQSAVDAVATALNDDDDFGVREIMSELDELETQALCSNFEQEEIDRIITIVRTEA